MLTLKKIKDVQFNDKPTLALKFQNIQIKKTTSNADYASLLGYDGDENIEVKIWSLSPEKKELLKTGDVYICTGSIKDYQGKKQFNVDTFYKASEDDVDLDSFYEYAPLNEQELQTKISGYVKKIDNPLLKKIVLTTINKYCKEYFTYPAAVSVHHNFIYGLAYHVYSMLTLSDTYLKFYEFLNKDLVYAGIILHDIGKVKELSSSKGPEYTIIGNLEGHISIGANMLYSVCEQLGCNDTEEAMALMHIILSHHGKNEYGSPVLPSIPEAALIFMLDYNDSRLAALKKACEGVHKGERTEGVFAFDKKSFYIPKV